MNKHGINTFIDETGNRYGRWLVLRRIEGTKKPVRWLCRCDCGRERSLSGGMLRSGSSRGCRPCSKRRHGMAGSPEYRSWIGMHRRCYGANELCYPSYGGRGITVCDRWNRRKGGSFENFFADMGPKPSPAHELDRIDVNGPYAPWNCQWADRSAQARNRTSNIYVDPASVAALYTQTVVRGERMVITDAIRLLRPDGIATSQDRERYREGLDA